MKLLHVSQPTSEGTAVVVEQLAVGAQQADFEVTVATPSEPGLPAKLRDLGVSWVELPMTRSPGLSDIRAILRMRRLLRDADLVHLHSSKAGAVGRVAAATLRVRPKVVFTPHGWSWYVGGRLERFYRAFERWAARFTDVIVTVSRAEQVDGVEVVTTRRTQIALVENGVDTTTFTPGQDDREAGLVVCVGRLSEQKGQDRLIRAVALCDRTDLKVRLVGDGPDRPELETLARELGVGERIEFLGTTDPLPHLRSAQLVVMPSRWEGLSIAMLEAMAAGNAIAYTPTGGTNLLSNVGIEIGGVSEADVIRSLATILCTDIHDGAKLREMGAAARSLVVKEYSVGRVTQEYRALWNSLLGA